MTRKKKRRTTKDLIFGNWTTMLGMTALMMVFIGASSSNKLLGFVAGFGQSLEPQDKILGFNSAIIFSILSIIPLTISYVLRGGLHLGVLEIIRGEKVSIRDILGMIRENLRPIFILSILLSTINVVFSKTVITDTLFSIGLIVIYPFIYMEIEHFDEDGLSNYIKRIVSVPAKTRWNIFVHNMYYLGLPLLVFTIGSIFYYTKYISHKNWVAQYEFYGSYSIVSVIFALFLLRNNSLLEIVLGLEYDDSKNHINRGNYE